MEHIHKTLERTAEIVDHAQNGSPTNSTRLQLPQMPRKWVAALFKRFQARWLAKWTSSIEGIEEIAVREWAEGLATLTPEHIRRGLAETVGDEWPPSMGEFRKACLGHKDHAGGDRHYCQTRLGENRAPLDPGKTLPARNRTPTTVEKAEQGISGMREAIRGRGQAKNNHNPGDEAMGVLRTEPRHTETAVLSDQGEKEHSQ